MMEKREDLKRVVENINQRDQLLSMEDDKVNQKYGAEVEETITAQETLQEEAKKKEGSYVYETDIKSAEQGWKGATNMVLPQTVVEDKTKRMGCDYSIAKEITTLAGSSKGFADGDGDQTKFRFPQGICWNPHDKCLYLCDTENNAIRRITLQGQVSTLAHQGLLSLPVGIVVHYKTNTFFVTNNGSHSICKITTSGLMSVHAGSGERGNQDGLGTNARFNLPTGITIDQQTDTLYVSDCHSIRKITLQGEVSTVAGSEDEGDVNGNGNRARFYFPYGLWFDEKHQSLLVCDRFNNKLKRVSMKGDVSTVVYSLDGARFVTIANTSILISSDCGEILLVTEPGEARVIQQHTERGEAKECEFNNKGLRGLVVDEETNTAFVVNRDHHVIKKITF